MRFQEIILTKTILKILKDFVRLYWFYEILRDFFQKNFLQSRFLTHDLNGFWEIFFTIKIS